jgi:hemerythrin-like domain-containing protein
MSPVPSRSPANPAAIVTTRDGFEVLDACHRQTVLMLDQLTLLLARMERAGADAQARGMASEIVGFFSTTARQHHEDEERHIFPKMLTSGDPDTVRAVLRLQQDHHWLGEDWMEISPQIDAIANGQSWCDIDILREGVEIFTALSHEHVALEESCIYPQAREQLGASERAAMAREMDSRREAQQARREARQR